MLKKLQEKFFPSIIALTALAVSASAAFYSVYGLSKLFAGASLQVIIMTGTLEVAKLVIASLLYQYWTEINKILRLYLLSACFILMVITSGGIYGFLSAAYQETANQSQIAEKELAVIEMKRTRFTESREEYKREKETINNTIKDLRVSLSNPNQVQYVHRETGQLITTTSSSQRRALQKELGLSVDERTKINLKLEAVTDSISQLDIDVLNKESNNEAEQELGPLRYISELTGTSMNKIVNYLLLLIVFVFDPLAIALVVTANFAFSKKKPLIDEDINLEDLKFETIVPEGKEFNTPYPLSEIMNIPKKEDIPKDDIVEQVERKAERVKAPTPESNVTPSDISNTQREYFGETEELNSTQDPYEGMKKNTKKRAIRRDKKRGIFKDKDLGKTY